ncbi:hypothetical protein [Sorangium sp. So ce1151]|uniref:hypothetical protein n=1 Tax=Sorangium sp. So ce1151 TaxID=3133332 RepID=UPI003F5DF4E9
MQAVTAAASAAASGMNTKHEPVFIEEAHASWRNARRRTGAGLDSGSGGPAAFD